MSSARRGWRSRSRILRGQWVGRGVIPRDRVRVRDNSIRRVRKVGLGQVKNLREVIRLARRGRVVPELVVRGKAKG